MRHPRHRTIPRRSCSAALVPFALALSAVVAPPEARACDGSSTPPRPLVSRLYNPASYEHFYTRFDAETTALGTQGWSIEAHPYYALAPEAGPGLVPFYRCLLYWASTSTPRARPARARAPWRT